MTGRTVSSTPILIAALLISVLLHLVLLFGWRAKVETLGVTGIHKPMTISLKTRETSVVFPSEVTAGKSVGEASASYLDASAPNPGSLTKPAQLIDAIDQNFSWAIGALREGQVTMRLVIGVDGHPMEVNVLKSNLPRNMEGEVVRRFYEARYAPGEIDSRPVVSEMVVEVDLR